MLAHGFARVSCESCKDEQLVAFSCKGRGVCPSCNAKRAHVTAVHLVEQVLPHVPYRQWTLSFPHRVRWVLLKDVGLLSDVLTVFLRAVFTLSGELFTHELLLLGALTPVRTGGGTQLPGMRLRAKEAADEGHIHLLLPRISWRWVEVDDVRAQVLAAGEGPVHPCLARVRGLRPKERRRI